MGERGRKAAAATPRRKRAGQGGGSPSGGFWEPIPRVILLGVWRLSSLRGVEAVLSRGVWGRSPRWPACSVETGGTGQRRPRPAVLLVWGSPGETLKIARLTCEERLCKASDECPVKCKLEWRLSQEEKGAVAACGEKRQCRRLKWGKGRAWDPPPAAAQTLRFSCRKPAEAFSFSR